MADVTISSLPQGTPSGNHLLPYSTGSNTLRTPVSAIFQNVSNVICNGVRTIYFSGTSQGNQLISQTVYFWSSSPVKVSCAFNHWYQQDYNANRECYISASPYSDPYIPILVDDIINRSSVASGGWSFSRPTTNANPGPGYNYPISDKLVINKSAGNYGGSSNWWIKIEGNANGLNTYPV